MGRLNVGHHGAPGSAATGLKTAPADSSTILPVNGCECAWTVRAWACDEKSNDHSRCWSVCCLGDVTQALASTPPADTVPANESAPFGTAPFGTAPFGEAPFGTAPTDTAPADMAPVDTAPVDTSPAHRVKGVQPRPSMQHSQPLAPAGARSVSSVLPLNHTALPLSFLASPTTPVSSCKYVLAGSSVSKGFGARDAVRSRHRT